MGMIAMLILTLMVQTDLLEIFMEEAGIFFGFFFSSDGGFSFPVSSLKRGAYSFDTCAVRYVDSFVAMLDTDWIYYCHDHVVLMMMIGASFSVHQIF